MRLEKYINESSKIKIDTEDPDKIVDILHKDCGKYINMLKLHSGKMRQKMVYRGMTKTYNKVMKIFPRTDRKPLDTPKLLHDYLNKLFKEKFGWEPRTEGVMTSSRPRSLYGKVYYFFPADGFKFIHSTDVNDLYTDLGDLLDMDFHDIDYTNSKITSKIKKVIDTYQQNENFQTVYRHSAEIMWKCKFYYILSIKSPFMHTVLEKL
jgi:hypothetical protein